MLLIRRPKAKGHTAIAGIHVHRERPCLGWGWLLTGLVGDVRIQVTSASPGRPVFVAIGPADRVVAYLSGTAYMTVTSVGTGGLMAGLLSAALIWVPVRLAAGAR